VALLVILRVVCCVPVLLVCAQLRYLSSCATEWSTARAVLMRFIGSAPNAFCLVCGEIFL
jgi:hypothetical protein